MSWTAINLALLLINAMFAAENILRQRLRLAWACIAATAVATGLYLFCLARGI
jgi:hypothetical protein